MPWIDPKVAAVPIIQVSICFISVFSKSRLQDTQSIISQQKLPARGHREEPHHPKYLLLETEWETHFHPASLIAFRNGLEKPNEEGAEFDLSPQCSRGEHNQDQG